MTNLKLKISPELLKKSKNIQKKFDAQKTHDKFNCKTNYIGLLGEMVFNEYLKKIKAEFEWEEFVKKGWSKPDFVIDEKSIDLKTTFSDVMWMQKERFDIYIYSQINKEETELTLKGWLSKDEIAERKCNEEKCKVVFRGNRRDWVFDPLQMFDLKLLSWLKLSNKNTQDAFNF